MPEFDEMRQRNRQFGEWIDESQGWSPSDGGGDFCGAGVAFCAELQRRDAAHREPDDDDAVDALSEFFEGGVCIVVPVAGADADEGFGRGVMTAQNGHFVVDAAIGEEWNETADRR